MTTETRKRLEDSIASGRPEQVQSVLKDLGLDNFEIELPSDRGMDKRYYVLIAILLAALYLLADLVFHASFWGWLIATAIGAGMTYIMLKKAESEQTNRKCTVSPDLSEAIKAIISAVQALMKESKLDESLCGGSLSLESPQYMPMLKRIYDDYVDSDDSMKKKKLSWILEKAGYELLEYSEDDAAMFDQYESNITEVTTTVKALVNRATHRYVFKGIVLFPMNK